MVSVWRVRRRTYSCCARFIFLYFFYWFVIIFFYRVTQKNGNYWKPNKTKTFLWRKHAVDRCTDPWLLNGEAVCSSRFLFRSAAICTWLPLCISKVPVFYCVTLYKPSIWDTIQNKGMGKNKTKTAKVSIYVRKWKKQGLSSGESRLEQCFSTAGPRPGTGPWHQLYRAARGSPGICHFSFLSKFLRINVL